MTAMPGPEDLAARMAEIENDKAKLERDEINAADYAAMLARRTS